VNTRQIRVDPTTQSKRRHAQAPRLKAFSATVLLGLLLGCTGSPSNINLVLSGLTPDVFLVQITATLNGVTARDSFSFPRYSSGPNVFKIELEPNVPGTLVLDAQGFDNNYCPIVESRTVAQVDPATATDLTLAFHLIPSRLGRWVEQFSFRRPASLASIWALDANSVWAAGNEGLIVQWNGSAWVTHVSGTTNRLFAIWGADTNNVWAVGDQGTLLHWNGSAWVAQISGTTSPLLGIWGADASNVWVVGHD
jgi:hypothetical protein